MSKDSDQAGFELGSLGYTPVGNELQQEKLFMEEVPLLKDRGIWHKIRFYIKTNPIKVLGVLFLLANYLYMSSDEICPYTNDETCVVKFMLPKAPIWIAKVTTAALIFMCIILLGLWYKRISRIPSVLAIANVIYLSMFYDDVIDHNRYGQAFGMFLQLEMGLFFFSFFLYQSIKKCCSINRKITAFAWLTSIVVFSTMFYFQRVHDSCRNWDKGFGGVTIDNNIACAIPIPTFCGFDVVEGFFDFSYFMDCKRSGANFAQMEEKYPHTPVIGFPRIENAPNENRVGDNMSDWVLGHMVGLESRNDPKAANLEIFIDQTDKENVQMIIDVKRNETLVNERSKIESDFLADNILVIYIDTLSRPSTFRKLPKTLEWFSKFYDNKESDRETFQFLKYMSITPYTQNNLLAAFHGVSPPVTDEEKANPPKEPVPSYAKTLKEGGYITGRSLDMCDTSLLFIDPSLTSFVRDIPFDHEGNAFSCDPAYYDPRSPLGLWQGPYSNIRRCLYGKDTFDYVLDYGEQFWNTYTTEKKFFYLEFIDAHESTQEAVTYMDQPLADFLKRLEDKGQLDDTIILFYSDHGLHLPSFTDIFAHSIKAEEKALPTMFLTVPRRIADKHGENIKANEQKVVSCWQVHDFFLSLPAGDQSDHFKKSMMGDLPDLTCNDIVLANQECYCQYPNK